LSGISGLSSVPSGGSLTLGTVTPKSAAVKRPVLYAAAVSEPIDKAAFDLEWQPLLEHVAKLCASDAARRRISALTPFVNQELARARNQLVAEAIDASQNDVKIPSGNVPDAEHVVARLSKGATANAKELLGIHSVLTRAKTLRSHARSERAERPRLAAALDSDPRLDPLLVTLSESIEPDGSVADSASPELRSARRRVSEARKELQGRLGALARRYSEVLRDEYWTERDGRYVLPVRSDAHLPVEGIVLGSSASGATLYVEPQEITALGNRLKLAEAEVEREEARVLARLSGEAAALAEEIARALEACVEADVLASLARWAELTRSIAVVPDAEARIDLRAARHPLLVAQGGEVVPNDIVVGAGQALIVSGPNAGGKTVALKCLGLAAWMARCGLPLPVDPGSRVGWFDPVLTDVGDDQSLLRSLSTFSAHVENLARIVDRAREHALVLLDEVAAGTDPEEGAALAAAVLEALVEKRAAVAVTTHYERLKELAAAEGPFQNASMGFDLARMAPTFRLVIGVPGASSALAVAQRFGMPSSIVERAEALMPERALDREELVQRLEHERQLLETARRLAENELELQRRLSAEMESERQKARAMERARLAEEARQLAVAVREARARLRELEKRFSRAEPPTKQELRAAEREVDEAARHIAVGSALDGVIREREPAPEPSAAEEIRIGVTVRAGRLGVVGEVVEAPERGQVKILAGALKLSVPLDDLVVVAAKKPKPKQEPKKKPAAARGPSIDGFVPMRMPSNTLDLRGKRVDEALEEVDAFVDLMLRQNEPVAYVLHGHGTGALKLAVRSHLSAARYVKRAKPAEADDGGDAFTVFWLGDS
jgi:DNA mismatch repair protein MutS2